jgi:hypothetical protein
MKNHELATHNRKNQRAEAPSIICPEQVFQAVVIKRDANVAGKSRPFRIGIAGLTIPK